VKFFQKWNKN